MTSLKRRRATRRALSCDVLTARSQNRSWPMGELQQTSAEYSFVKDFCVPFLLGAQNQDGGWGFEQSANSRVEPTCWAVRALCNAPVPVSKECLKSGLDYLLLAQLKDGSWPAVSEEDTGCWVTSLACSVLSSDKTHEGEVRAGLKWLCDDYPRDSALWRRILGHLRSSKPVSSHDNAFRGWGWTPNTSSWVEPTAFAMLALSDCPEPWRPGTSEQRLDLALGLLYDRMCPGGGWNCGNPMVYGVAGEPLVLPTAWALLALCDYPLHERKTASLKWLSRTFATISSPASLAVARLTLEAHGVELPKSCRNVHEMFDARAFLRTTEVVSWTCLALSPRRNWFPKVESVA
jgi:hypothetical protein